MTDLKRHDLTDVIQKIPKTDLHCHLDGSIRPATLIELSRTEKIDLPSFTEDGLNQTLFRDSYPNLEAYLNTFEYSCAVMQKPEYLERIAYELCLDAEQEGVRYIEVRFAPQLHVNDRMNMKQVLQSVNRGLFRAKMEMNQKSGVKSGKLPPFQYGIIVCALRSIGPYSRYYKHFIDSFSFSDSRTVAGLCSLELARAAVRIRDDEGIPIVGFDLAGAEAGNPAKDHIDAFRYVHEHFMSKTVHAGEAYGAASIFQAITELNADRIGHGYYLYDESKISNAAIADKRKYIYSLSQYIANHRVTIEVCLTSNLQTNPDIQNLKNHRFTDMLEHGLSTTFCTDNRTVSKTTVTQEILLALNHFDIGPDQLKNIIIYGFKRSFYPGPYLEKRRYVRQCIDYYEQLVKGTVLDPAQK